MRLCRLYVIVRMKGVYCYDCHSNDRSCDHLSVTLNAECLEIVAMMVVVVVVEISIVLEFLSNLYFFPSCYCLS